MRILFTLNLLLLNLFAIGQIQQMVNTSAIPFEALIAGIDSIVFDPVSQEMHIIKTSSVQTISLVDVVNVTFEGILDPTQSSCGADSVSNPSSLISFSYIEDQDQHVYRTILLGPYEMMAENLNTSHYQNGDEILNVQESSAWSDLLVDSIGAWAYYNNDPSYECPQGKLYNWFAVSDSRGLCPTGWHIPSDQEWSDFITYFGVGSVIAAGPMKSTGFMYWDPPNEGASNERGFSALPGGRRTLGGNFNSIRTTAYWWLSDANSGISASCKRVSFSSLSVITQSAFKPEGLSVRCMKD